MVVHEGILTFSLARVSLKQRERDVHDDDDVNLVYISIFLVSTWSAFGI